MEIVLAHPLGIAEVAEGTLEGTTIQAASTSVATTSTGSPVTVLRRRIEVRDDHLTYELHMAMHEVAMMRHLCAELARS